MVPYKVLIIQIVRTPSTHEEKHTHEICDDFSRNFHSVTSKRRSGTPKWPALAVASRASLRSLTWEGRLETPQFQLQPPRSKVEPTDEHRSKQVNYCKSKYIILYIEYMMCSIEFVESLLFCWGFPCVEIL